MTQFKDALEKLISPAMVTKASQVLDEKESNLSKAISVLIPSFLGVLLKHGNTPQIKNILHEAGNLNILVDLERICEEKPTQEQQKIGDDFLQHLLGDKAVNFTNPIADKAGISKVATNRLVSMIAPIVAGYLGNKLVKENRNMPNLLGQIEEQKSGFLNKIPEDIIKSFNLSSEFKNNHHKSQEEEKKSSLGWLKWLIFILFVVLLFLWWRSCDSNKPDVITSNPQAVLRADTTGQQSNPQAIASSSQDIIKTKEITLSNGAKISVYENGIEDKMVKFLNSDEYKNAKDDALKNKWFEFSDIRFEFGSGTQLIENSSKELDNIAAILKSYPDAKIKIAGLADKKGTEKANMEVSKQRAKTIETMFENRGVGSQIAKAEGYGDEFAKHNANESDSKRSEDRDFALRFVK